MERNQVLRMISEFWHKLCLKLSLPWDFQLHGPLIFGFIYTLLEPIWIGFFCHLWQKQSSVTKVWNLDPDFETFSHLVLLFHFDVISDLQKNCKNDKKYSYIHFTQISKILVIFPYFLFLCTHVHTIFFPPKLIESKLQTQHFLTFKYSVCFLKSRPFPYITTM